jgi:hypothetical protein
MIEAAAAGQASRGGQGDAPAGQGPMMSTAIRQVL